MNKTIKPVVEKSALPTKKRSTWKWNLPLESIKKGELIKLEMSEDEARDNSNTIRTIVHRFQKKTPSVVNPSGLLPGVNHCRIRASAEGVENRRMMASHAGSHRVDVEEAV